MRVLVIGAGAVGGFLGARAALAGHDVTLVARAHLAEAVRSRGLSLTEPDGSVRTAGVSAVDSIAGAFSSNALYDLALLTVKAYDTEQVTAELAAVGRILPALVTLQNGVGNEEALVGAFGRNAIISGAIDTPVSVPAPGEIQVHRARYRVGLAPVGLGAPLAMAVALFRDAGLQTKSYSDYRRLKWSKLVLNLPANASCAILDWSPAQVMAHPVACRLDAQAWQEALQTMARLGVRPLALAGYPLPFISPLARLLSPAVLARFLAKTVSGGRGTKRPSLHIALADSRRSEVMWLNGAVARAANVVGTFAPVNKVFADVLTTLTEDHAAWDDWRGRPDRLLSAVQRASRYSNQG